MKDKPDPEADVLLIAHSVGLQKAVAEFRKDVLAAAKAAADARAAFTPTHDAAVEPWPPMKVGDA